MNDKSFKNFQFLTILSNFCKIFKRLRGETRLQGRNISPVGFFNSLMQFSKSKKYLKLEPKTTKIPQFTFFQSFCAISVTIPTGTVNRNV